MGQPFPYTDCKTLIRQAASDIGLKELKTPGQDLSCPSYQYVIYAVIAPNEDFHWYRQESDKTWTHKRASGPVERLVGWPDRANHDYTNAPRKGPNYTLTCGYYCWPYSGRLP